MSRVGKRQLPAGFRLRATSHASLTSSVDPLLSSLYNTFVHAYCRHRTNGLFKKWRRRPQIQVGMAARHGYYYTPVTPLEDPTNSFVEIASALIHDCLVGIECDGTAFSNREILVSLSIQSVDLQEQ